MSYLGREQLRQLEAFVDFCKMKPEILHKPELSFFKQYLESLGAKISPAPRSPSPPPKTKQTEEVNMEEPTPRQNQNLLLQKAKRVKLSWTTVELWSLTMMIHCLWGDSSVEVTEEQMEQSSEKRGQAMEAQSEGKLEESLKLWTEAIELNPSSAILFAKRANVLLKMEKPNAAIRDANKALELNPDQALGYKIRGRAHRLLGHWEEAAKDLATACRLDYTDEANEWLKEVAPNAKKLQEHRRKWERKREERELKERAERACPAAWETVSRTPRSWPHFRIRKWLAAFQDISQNPMNIGKYQSNPKIKNIMTKMAAKMGAQAPPM
ncbi:hypothetical protein MRX96_035584 [Rhipicephalus microplus]